MASSAQVRINLDSGTPVNRQIVDQLRTLLVEGVLGPDDTLPSVRRLAIDLGIHFNTVADAYRILAEEGWLEISHGRGARVVRRQAPRASDETVRMFRERLRQLVAEMRAQGLSSPAIARELGSLMEVVQS